METKQTGVLSYRGIHHKVPKNLAADQPEIQIYKCVCLYVRVCFPRLQVRACGFLVCWCQIAVTCRT